MSKLEDLQPGLRLAGVIPGQNVSVIAVQPHGVDAIELTYKTAEGDLGQRVLGREAEEKLAIASAEARPLDADAADFKLVSECQRIKLAGLFDPMLAVTTSDIEPLPTSCARCTASCWSDGRCVFSWQTIPERARRSWRGFRFGFHGKAHASDLNPVAVLINKALIDIPTRFAGDRPRSPGLPVVGSATGKGAWLERRRARLQGVLDDGSSATAIAWIWARTVTCPNPACGIEMPLVRSWWLGKKRGKEVWVRPVIVANGSHASGRRVDFEIGHGRVGSPTDEDATVGRNGARCLACGAAVALEYVRATSRDAGSGAQLMAIVAEGDRRRVYLPPDDEQTCCGCRAALQLVRVAPISASHATGVAFAHRSPRR